MRDIRNKSGFLFLVPLILFVHSSTAAQTFHCVDVANPNFPSKPTQVCTLHEPNNAQPLTAHPEIRFTLKDEVTVDAGGCAQTGGHGKTWKRYVDPTGDNSDRLYMGLIDIPFITAGLVPIRSIVGKTRVIEDLPHHGVDPCDLYLKLGYSDDHYEDNNYERHDDGTQDQCRGVENAWIRITIKHHNPDDDIPDQKPAAPMDLWWHKIDDNFLPLNPLWGLQELQNAIPNPRALCNDFHNEGDHLQLGGCTTWLPTVDEPDITSNPFYYTICHLPVPPHDGVHGHINWGYGTYTGKVYFEDYQGSVGEDHDYDMGILRDNQEGLTTGNDFGAGGKIALSMEFNGDETIPHMNTPWWQKFYAAVLVDGLTSGDWAQSKRLVDGKQAIAIGLVGIDNQHDAKAEMHPLFGLAIHVKDDPCDDVWAVYARNWGNEGSCSQDIHMLANDNVEFFFPNVGSEAYTINESASDFQRVLSSRYAKLDSNYASTFSTELGNEVLNRRYEPQTINDYWGAKVYDDGVVLNLFLTAPNSRSIVHGEIHLRRSSCTSPQPALEPVAEFNKPDVVTSSAMTTPTEPDDDALLLLTYMTKEQRRRYFEKYIGMLKRDEQRFTVYSVRMNRKDDIVERHSRELTAKEPRTQIPVRSERDIFALENQQQQYAALVYAMKSDQGAQTFLSNAIRSSAPTAARNRSARAEVISEYRDYVRRYNSNFEKLLRGLRHQYQDIFCP